MSEDIFKEIDSIRKVAYFSREKEYPWAIMNSEVESGMRILDIGCGDTPFILYLNKIGCESFAIDFAEHEPYYKDTGVAFITGEMEELPFEDEYFDRIFLISVIEHVTLDTLKSGIQEIKRTLKKGGLAVIVMDYDNSCRLNGFAEEYFNEFLKAGLKLVKRQDDVYKDLVFGFILRR